MDEREEAAPAAFALLQNYPNPFNPVTNIQFSVGASGGSPAFVTLKVYDVLGKEVATLVNEKKPAGIYRVSFDAAAFTSGVYFVKMFVGDLTSASGQEFVATRKILLVR